MRKEVAMVSIVCLDLFSVVLTAGGGGGVKVMTAISTHWPGITKSGSADVGKAKGIFFLPPFQSRQMGNTNLFQHNSVSAPPHFCHLIRCKLHPLKPEVNSPRRHTFDGETGHLLDSCFPLDSKFRVFSHRQDLGQSSWIFVSSELWVGFCEHNSHALLHSNRRRTLNLG